MGKTVTEELFATVRAYGTVPKDFLAQRLRRDPDELTPFIDELERQNLVETIDDDIRLKR